MSHICHTMSRGVTPLNKDSSLLYICSIAIRYTICTLDSFYNIWILHGKPQLRHKWQGRGAAAPNFYFQGRYCHPGCFPGSTQCRGCPMTFLHRCSAWQRPWALCRSCPGPVSCQISYFDEISAISGTAFPSGNRFLSLFRSSLRALPQPLTLLHRHCFTSSSIL